MKICFATNNVHKIEEVQAMLPEHIQLVSLAEIGCHEELPETQTTLEGNARQKAMYVWDNYRMSCFADDTGLEVQALHNEPGVYSARYAGPQRSAADNMALLLERLSGKNTREARFRTVISLVLDGKEMEFEGIVDGHIAEKLEGEGGFGYDPIFIPDGQVKTFAQLSKDEKNQVSHRGIATRKLVAYLEHLP